MNTVLSAVLFHVPVEAIDVSQHFHNSLETCAHFYTKIPALSKFITGVRNGVAKKPM